MKNVKTGHTRPVVCLDAGHCGKYNRSPVVPEYYESDMTWKLHLLVKAELEKHGIEVRLTREAQEADLNAYCRGTASDGCDLFLSLHSNAAERESADYPVVYVQLNGSGNALGEQIAGNVERLMKTKEPGRINTRQGENGDYYGVLRGSAAVGTTGLIIEHSFHTNERSARWLLAEENLLQLAMSHGETVAEWFDVRNDKTSASEPERWYRIRKSWEDAESQTAAYKGLDGAIKACAVGYSVFDWNGNAVYRNFPASEKQEVTFTLTFRQLQKGDQGGQVKAMQLILIASGCSCGIHGADGIFGGDTEQAVREYQQMKGLAIDGIAGPDTWAHLSGIA